MHLLSRYALSSASKVGKPFILSKFFPLAVEKYITLHPYSKYESKKYDFMQDVVDIIHPYLQEKNIHIVQIGTAQDKPLHNCYTAFGQTNLGQAAFIISNALLHLGADSFATHIASGYGKKIVALYSNNFPKVVGPYWSKESDIVQLSPKTNNKPCFAAEEAPKSINTILPEDIAAAVLNLLGIKMDYQYRTLKMGTTYHSTIIESVPNQIINPQVFGTDSLIVRMDFLFNENILEEQLKTCPCSIVTTKSISERILRNYKSRIKEVIYQIDDDGDLEFVKKIQNLNLLYFLISSQEGDGMNNLKLKFLDFPLIHFRGNVPVEEAAKLKLNNPLFYQSNKITLSDGKLFTSKEAWKQNIPVDNHKQILPVLDTDDFWRELENFKILSTNQ